jgi:serine/threonine-protein kinase
MAMGRFDDALRDRQKAQEMDPLSPTFTEAVGWSYFYARDYDRAIEWYRKAIELDPNFVVGYNDLGTVNFVKGNHRDAVAAFVKARALSGDTPERLAALEEAYAKEGITGFWKKQNETALAPRSGRVNAFQMARICTALGDRDRAFSWLDKAVEERSALLIFLKVNPFFDSLHSDARFGALLRRIGLEK